ncbi:MAG: TlpA family protein disulfide reductase [Phycisphaerae bacterium]|nr:TlpA family protein disulfide reductase [Phycisphaerae bacterium]
MTLLLMAFAAVGPVGCQSSGSAGRTVEASNDSIYRYSAYRYQYPPTPPVMDASSLREFVDQYRHQTVVLEFWASWSPTSRSDLSPLADFQEETYADGVRVIACTFDPSDEWASRVVPILQSARANYPCVVIPRSARLDIGRWLDESWQFDLPARFVLDSDGRVAFKAIGGETFHAALEEARSLTGDRTPNAKRVSVTDDKNSPSSIRTVAAREPMAGIGPVSLRVRLINVSTGEAESLPIVTSPGDDPDLLASELVSYMADRLDRTNNQRIAVLPFAPTNRRTAASEYGRQTAARVEAGLRRKGFYDLIGPSAAQSMVDDLGLSALSIDYDPTIARRRLGADFLVIGWIKGAPIEEPDHSGSIAIDSSEENPGAD